MNYQRYLASREWRVKRREILARSIGMCERCWCEKATQVHHVTYERVGRELPEDLLALCAPCHEFLSATTDHDPVLALPTLAGPDDGWMGAELSKLAGLEIASTARVVGGDDADHTFKEVVGVVADAVRWWTRYSCERFRSLPENQYAIAHAGSLFAILKNEHEQALEIVAPILVEVGLASGDPWHRWRVPLRWLNEVAA